MPDGARPVGGILVPPDALVLLVGPAGAGKSTFARRSFPSEAVLSADAFRAMVSGDAADQTATEPAFRLLHAAAAERLARGQLTVIDATNVLFAARDPLLALAAQSGRPTVAIVFEVSLADALAGNAQRPERVVPSRIVRRQQRIFQRAVPHLRAEGLRVERLRGPAEIAAARVILGS